MSSLLVLIVDDDPLKRRTLARALGRALRPLTIEVEAAGTLQAANARLDVRRPDLAIVDWSFPRAPGESEVRGTGREVVERCRREGVPFLVASSEEVEPDLRGAWLADWRPEVLAADVARATRSR